MHGQREEKIPQIPSHVSTFADPAKDRELEKIPQKLTRIWTGTEQERSHKPSPTSDMHGQREEKVLQILSHIHSQR